MGSRVEIGFELRTTYSDTIINNQLFQKFKLLGNGEFNHLTNILLDVICEIQRQHLIIVVKNLCYVQFCTFNGILLLCM